MLLLSRSQFYFFRLSCHMIDLCCCRCCYLWNEKVLHSSYLDSIGDDLQASISPVSMEQAIKMINDLVCSAIRKNLQHFPSDPAGMCNTYQSKQHQLQGLHPGCPTIPFLWFHITILAENSKSGTFYNAQRRI